MMQNWVAGGMKFSTKSVLLDCVMLSAKLASTKWSQTFFIPQLYAKGFRVFLKCDNW